MRKLLLLSLVLLSLVPLAFAQEEVEQLYPIDETAAAAAAEALDETARFWFVELASAPAADGTSLTTLKNEKNAFRSAARRAGVTFTERYAFDTLWNGLSIEVGPSGLSAIRRMDGVRAVWPVVEVSLPASVPDEGADLATALAMTGANLAQSALGLSGAGVKVAVMDTGIDYHHPDLGGGCFGNPSCRVITGYDLVGDAFNADPTSPSYNPIPVPDNNPDDCAGHGTHVAGIVGARGTVTGVAPQVSFGAYRVFGCNGSTTADVMIAAMERALADGMQVLNMSIGSAFQWPQYPTATASDRLVNKGVVVVASIGNSGADGVWSAGAPGLGKKVIGVASFDNSHVRLRVFTITPDAMAIGYQQATGSPAAPRSGNAPMKRTGTSASTADACSALPAGSLTGQVALIRRGTCSFYQKARNAQLAGATGVVLYNNVSGRISPTVAGSPAVTIPVVSVSNAEGVLINNRLAAGAVTMTWTSQVASFPNATGNLISSFSSYGISPDLMLKPDIGAPGGLIYSTYPVELGSYATLSGTSMSSPHVAGAVALLLEARPHTSPGAVAARLLNSADPKPWWGNPGLGFLDNTARQGAGMLDIDDSILSTVKIEPAKLSLGESELGPVTRTLTISNEGSVDATYNLTHAPALSLGGTTFVPAFFTGFAAASFTVGGLPASAVTVPSGGTATVDVTITANALLADRAQFGGYVVVTPQGGGASYRVPYAGIKGDYQSIVALTPTVNGFPWLAKLVGASFFKQAAGATYTLASGDLPYILLHLNHQVRTLRLEVVDANGQSWHRILDQDYVGRNRTANGFFSLTWDGTTFAGKKTYTVPDGQYSIVVSVQKALGDGSPAHWESWTSPTITIDRP